MELIPNIQFRHPDFYPIVGEDYKGFLRGYFYHDHQCITHQNFANLYPKADFQASDFENWNGEFALVIQRNEEVVLVTDKKRSIPLFYSQSKNQQWLIQDFVEQSSNTKLQEDAVEEFLITGFVAGSKTMFQEWSQVEAASYVTLGSTAKQAFYYSFVVEKETKELSEWTSELASIFNDIFDDLAKRLEGKQIIIPLSGGYDSRLISIMLCERGLKDQITTFTYGRPGNGESTVSKQIADRLGLRWKYFEYNKELWSNMYQSKEWEEYVQYSSNGVSVAHLQDFPSTQKLTKEENLKNAVFIPGHSLDYLAGGHLPHEAVFGKNFTQDEVIQFILNKHHRLWTPVNGLWAGAPTTIQGIRDYVSKFDDYSNENVCNIIDEWNWRERQSKFIINSVRIYEFFGQDWTLPLWDDRLIYFFSNIPVEWKYKKYLYDLTVHEMFPDFYDKPTKPSPEVSLRSKYGPLYPVLRKIYRKRNLLKQYYTEPMEWFGIYPTYQQYVRSLSIKMSGQKYKDPYNVNSFIVKDMIQKMRETTK